ncbi:MAG TPA: ankyrin repeat domain-containing protein [Pyrinomonadaceae bacterium]|nr:ankyrin repeat domain-containing protein [Pyrinomonadaceae bacterium]
MTDALTAESQKTIVTQALMRAIDEGDTARVKSLLTAGADVNATSNGGKTALMRATSRGYLDIVQVLLGAGADINAKKENGTTALIMAVFFGYPNIVRALLEGGADPSARTPMGTTAGEWAQTAGFNEIVELLRNADDIRARSRAAESASTPTEPVEVEEFFPSDGSFSPVVPLSQIGETTAAAAGVTASENAAEVFAVQAADNVEHESQSPEEQDEQTLVPARVTVSPAPRVPASIAPHTPPAARRGGRLQSWPVLVFSLAVILMAAAMADTTWKNSRQSVNNQQTAPVVENVPPPDSVQTQAAPPQASTAEAADLQTPPTASQVSDPDLSNARPTTVVSTAPPIASSVEGESSPKTETSDKPKSVAVAPPSVATSESRRAPDVSTTERPRAIDDSRARQRAAALEGAAKNSNPGNAAARQNPRPSRRAESRDGRALTYSTKGNSSPVSSAPPVKSEKREVIQWP